MLQQPSPLQALKRASRWMNDFAGDVTSQAGEDGILSKALSLLPHLSRWCVEFGASDGQYLSNTYNLVNQHSYNVILIEADPRKYRQMCYAYPHKQRAIFLNNLVGSSREDGLDQVLAPCPIPSDFDLLSIDVDGNDYHVWSALRKYRPKLVLIEYNPTMGNSVNFVQPNESRCCQGSSPAAIVRLAKEKAYELIAVTEFNLLFVDSRYYSRFKIADNSLEVMRDDSETPHIFVGYDGTVFLEDENGVGGCCLKWHGYRLSQRKVQVLPRVLRRYPPTYNWMQRWAMRVFFVLTQPRKLVFEKVRRYIKT